MRRAILLALFLALAGGVGWFVQSRHWGDLAAATAEAKAYALSFVPGSRRAPAPGGQAAAPAEGRPTQGEARGGGAGPRESQRIAVVSAVARTQDLTVTRSAIGAIEPIAAVTIRARTDGMIVEQRARDGALVKQGDVLFRLDDRELQAAIARDRAALARDEANLAKARSDLARAQELAAKGITAQVQIEGFAAAAKVAEANVAAGKASLEVDQAKLSYATVRAPISGRLGIVRVTEGNLVRGNDATGDGLVTITQMAPLRVSFALPERDLPLLRQAMDRKNPAAVRVYAGEGDKPLAAGALAFIDSSVDQTSGTITAKGLLPNADGSLWPGQYVRVELDVGARPNATTVPLVAIQPGQEGSYAYVVNADKVVERRRVEVAMSVGDVAAVASGVAPGEHVVVEGQLRLRDGSRVTETIAGEPPTNRTADAEAAASPNPKAGERKVR